MHVSGVSMVDQAMRCHKQCQGHPQHYYFQLRKLRLNKFLLFQQLVQCEGPIVKCRNQISSEFYVSPEPLPLLRIDALLPIACQEEMLQLSIAWGGEVIQWGCCSQRKVYKEGTVPPKTVCVSSSEPWTASPIPIAPEQGGPEMTQLAKKQSQPLTSEQDGQRGAADGTMLRSRTPGKGGEQSFQQSLPGGILTLGDAETWILT